MTRHNHENGQGMTELAVSLFLIISIVLTLDFISTVLLAQNRAEIFKHHLLFHEFRKSEGITAHLGPHPDPQHIQLKEVPIDFEDRKWFDHSTSRLKLHLKILPHFPELISRFTELQAIPFISEAVIFRDPWQEHPIGLIASGIGAAMSYLGSDEDDEFSQLEDNPEVQNVVEEVLHDFSQETTSTDFLKQLGEYAGS